MNGQFSRLLGDYDRSHKTRLAAKGGRRVFCSDGREDIILMSCPR